MSGWLRAAEDGAWEILMHEQEFRSQNDAGGTTQSEAGAKIVRHHGACKCPLFQIASGFSAPVKSPSSDDFPTFADPDAGTNSRIVTKTSELVTAAE